MCCNLCYLSKVLDVEVMKRQYKETAECKSLYDLVEKLQYRLEDMEAEHMKLIIRIGHLEDIRKLIRRGITNISIRHYKGSLARGSFLLYNM